MLFGDFVTSGGLERVLANMIPVWSAAGHCIEVVTFRNGTLFYPNEVGSHVSHHHLGTRGRLATLFALWRHLGKRPADAVLSCTHAANVVLCALKWLPDTHAHRVISVTNPYGQSRKNRSASQRRRKFREVRRFYPHADAVIAISEGVRNDLTNTIGLRGAVIKTIPNAVVTERTLELAREPVSHPWLDHHERPVIISAGRLAQQKDYPTLLRALARLHQRLEARLIILGEGPEREALERLINEIGLKGAVDLPGFVDNPYAWMARADLFVLSSAWEGFGNVLAEALSLGVPAVSTDCPGGPRDILGGGRHGVLVPVGDDHALASAMEEVLLHPADHRVDSSACRRFTAEHAAAEYLRAFGIPAHGG
ncbi:glycosyltransferase [Thioalkalivibrio denitrificans]|uniref:glycosyltransferase n=1 Tax=Thioalkalivibrio denitrificans TaxID=108003 RepID=UPI0026CBE7B2